MASSLYRHWHSLEPLDDILVAVLLGPFHVDVRIDGLASPLQIRSTINGEIGCQEIWIELPLNLLTLWSHLPASPGYIGFDWLALPVGEQRLEAKCLLQVIEVLASHEAHRA